MACITASVPVLVKRMRCKDAARPQIASASSISLSVASVSDMKRSACFNTASTMAGCEWPKSWTV